MSMKTLLFVLSLFVLGGGVFFLSSNSQADDDLKFWNPKWQACSIGDDCVLLEGVCGDWKSANKRFEEDAKKQIAYHMARVECAPSKNEGMEYTTECSERMCEAIIKEYPFWLSIW